MSEQVTSRDELTAAFEAAELIVTSRDDSSVTLRVISGLQARTATVPWAAVEAALGRFEAPARRTALSSFARGVYARLSEPKNSRGAEIGFEAAAATILPSIEGPLFCAGARAAGSDTPFLSDFPAGLCVAYLVELDFGVRLLTQPQVADWGTTHERVAKAALSILFHRSWGMGAEPVPGTGFERFAGYDGLDAARVLMLDQWDYPRVRKGMLFAVPNNGTLLMSAATDEQAARALATEARRRADESPDPLSTAVLRYDDARLQREPVAVG